MEDTGRKGFLGKCFIGNIALHGNTFLLHLLVPVPAKWQKVIDSQGEYFTFGSIKRTNF